MLLSIEHFWMSGWSSDGISVGLSDVLSASDQLVLSITISRSETASISDTISLSTSKNLSDSTTLSDAVSKTFARSLAETLTPSDSVVKLIEPAFFDEAFLSDNASKLVGLALSDTQTLADASYLASAYARDFSETIRLIDGRTSIRDYARQIDETVTLRDALGKSFSTSFSDGMSSEDGIGSASATLRKAETMTLDNQLVLAAAFYRDIAQSVNISSSTAFNLSRDLSSSVSMQDALTAVLMRVLYELLASTVGMSDTTIFSFTSNISSVVSLLEERRAEVTKSLVDQLVLLDQSAKLIESAIEDQVGVTDLLAIDHEVAEDVYLALSDTLTLTDTLSYALDKLLQDSYLVTDSPLHEVFIILSFAQSLYRGRLAADLLGFRMFDDRPTAAPVAHTHAASIFPNQFHSALISEVPTAEVFKP